MSRNIYYLLDKYFELKLNLQMKDGVITSITKNTHTNIVTGVTHYTYTVEGWGGPFDDEPVKFFENRKKLKEFINEYC